jgi:YHS domain-containing protein
MDHGSKTQNHTVQRPPSTCSVNGQHHEYLFCNNRFLERFFRNDELYGEPKHTRIPSNDMKGGTELPYFFRCQIVVMFRQ